MKTGREQMNAPSPVDLLQKENQQLRAALVSAREKITAIEVDSEEVLDFDECTAMLLSIDSYHDLTEVGEAIDAILSGQSVEDPRDKVIYVCWLALENAQGNINPERAFCDDVEAGIKEALAAIEQLKGKDKV